MSPELDMDVANRAANAIIAQQADELKRLSDRIDFLETGLKEVAADPSWRRHVEIILGYSLY